jgi:hypothetical protein
VTDAEVLAALMAREPIFHRPEFGTTSEDYARMMAPDYWEVGASGRVYRKTWVLEELERRAASGEADQELEASGFACRRLGADCWLLTYELLQNGVRRTRRATVWEWAGGVWRIVYHQGTIVQENSP